MPRTLLHTAARLHAPPDTRTDAALVRAFLRQRDHDAFALLVRRHGPAVLGACQRLLGHTPDAEDAFQATFLVLVRRAHTTHWREALGPWLYGVALKVARKARAARARRAARQETAMPEPAAPPHEPDDDGAILDQELAALPARYRVPLVLCEIQGRTRRDAAHELGVAEGTLSSRLARGRKMLRERLARRGLAPVLTGLTVAVPGPLARATVHHAAHLLTRTAGAVPAHILVLTEGVTKTMIATWKLGLVMVASCVALTGLGTWHGSAQQEPAARTAKASDTEPEKPAARSSGTTNPVPRVKIVAMIGESNLVTDQEVLEVMYQMPEVSDQAAPVAALDGAAGAVRRHLYARALRETIERELVLDEMYTKLKKASKVNLIEEIKEAASQTADRKLRALREDASAKSDEEFAARLRARGLTVPVLRRQMERQTMAEQYVSSALKEVTVNAPDRKNPAYQKFIEEEHKKITEKLWQKGVVRVLEDDAVLAAPLSPAKK